MPFKADTLISPNKKVGVFAALSASVSGFSILDGLLLVILLVHLWSQISESVDNSKECVLNTRNRSSPESESAKLCFFPTSWSWGTTALHEPKASLHLHGAH